jgi:broad specificity phosphatase PhoE
MMEVLLVRHGQPDYSLVESSSPKYSGHRFDLIHLSNDGESQVHALVPELRAFEPELIVSSPYPRCLHTAAILSRALDLDLRVHPDLHEWLPVRDGGDPVSAEIVREAEQAYWRNRTERSLQHDASWETDEDIRMRVAPVLDSYKRSFQKVLVVTHEVVIRALTGRLETALATAQPLTW